MTPLFVTVLTEAVTPPPAALISFATLCNVSVAGLTVMALPPLIEKL